MTRRGIMGKGDQKGGYKVYLVVLDIAEGLEIIGIFSSQEKAQTHISTSNEKPYWARMMTVQAWDIDATQPINREAA